MFIIKPITYFYLYPSSQPSGNKLQQFHHNTHHIFTMTSLKNVVNLLLMYSMVFAMTPFTCSIKNGTPVFSKRRKGFFYLLGMLLIISLVEVSIVYREFLTPSSYNNNTAGFVPNAVTEISHNVNILTIVLYICVTNFYTEATINFMNSIKKIENNMKKIGLNVSYRSSYRIQYVLLSVMLVKLVAQIASHFVDGGDIAHFGARNVHLFVIHVIAMQWVTFINMLTVQFEGINELLKTMKYRQCFVVEDFQEAVKIPVTYIIRECSVIYGQLCDLSRSINKAYVWQILFIVPANFITILSNTFYTCKMMEGRIPVSVQTITLDVICLISLFEFVLPCVYCKEEADKFVQILNKVDFKLNRNAEIEDIVSIE